MSDSISTGKYDELKSPWFSIVTCSYNRARTLVDCYEAIKQLELPVDDDGVPQAFEWIIVDDGSTDDTFELVQQWIESDVVPILYLKQPNQGKYVAFTTGINASRGYAVLSYDSDDILLPKALTILYNAWYSMSPEQRLTCKGVTGRTIDSVTGQMVGKPFPRQPFIMSAQDMRFKYRIKGEMIGFTLRSVYEEFPYPVGQGLGKSFPDSVVIFEIGKKYTEMFLNDMIRIYVTDGESSISKGSSRNRATQNYYLWQYEVNNLVSKYWFYSPKDMLKAVVGLTMDGFRTKRKYGEILRGVKSIGMKALVVLFTPCGYILSKCDI